MDIIQHLSDELHISQKQIQATVALLDEGNTVPFVARYRKEVTGGLDDGQLRLLSERLNYLRNLVKHREEIRTRIAALDLLTEELEKQLNAAATLTELDDLYRPFRPHRKTRASVAKANGLEPLARLLAAQAPQYDPPLTQAALSFLCPESGICSAEDALSQACDILAENISDDAENRKRLRSLTSAYGILHVRGTQDEESVYSNYYDFSERISTVADHRILAINRGEREGFLRVGVSVDRDIVLNFLFQRVLHTPQSPASPYITRAIIDSYDRLIAPSIEREVRAALTDRASENAIHVFSDNLRHLLLQPPVKGKNVLGLDPGYRTGCKLAVVDRTGKVLQTAVIYPTKPKERVEEARTVVCSLIETYEISLVCIGNGTASKESERFIAQTLKQIGSDCKYTIVSEAGASVYSASELAAEEFPSYDVTQRSAVSIARRIQDPLAELVKIDPKAIGVGQYQHDMKPARLDEALGGVVESCVNSVGVDLNTASWPLLSYVAGINTASAKNIVKFREENGEFKSRAQLKKVPRIGEKAYEQCAGFLRVNESQELLDHTGVHPESYPAAKALLQLLGYTQTDITTSGLSDIQTRASVYGKENLCAALNIGALTLTDILAELQKPGRDPRDTLPAPLLREDIMELSDLAEGMVLEGTVRNVTDFGAFVDIGVHQDGLVHCSKLANHFVKHPRDVVSIGDIVKVKVLSVNLANGRIALSMRDI